MRAGERRSDVESELMSDDPTDLDDMVFSDEEESREVVVTSAERCDPAATSAGEEQEAARRAEVPASRKRVASTDVVGERVAKQTRSPRPSTASLVSSLPMVDVAEQGGRSEERTGTRSSLGSVTIRDLQPGTALPATDAVEQAGQSKEQTGARALCDLQSADVPPVAPVWES